MTPVALAARLTGRRRRLAWAALVAVLLGLLTILYAAVAPRGSTASGAVDPVMAGKSLYNEGCATCHGFNGEGSNNAPSLIGVGAAAVDFQVSTGRMPAQHRSAEMPRKRVAYNPEQISDLDAYVASFASGPAVPNVSGYQKADVAYGGSLFRTNCAQCHNFVGSGGELTYGKYAPSMSDATPTQIYEAMITGPENMPVFGDKTLTHDQKLALINYVKTVQKEANPGGAGLGRIGPVSETVVGFLAGLGLCVVATLWIGSRA